MYYNKLAILNIQEDVMTTLNFDKALATQLIINHFGLSEEWKLTDSDIEILNFCMKRAGVNNNTDITTIHSFESMLDDNLRVDSKSNLLIVSGYVLFDGVEYYADEKDAIEAYNKAMGTQHTSFATIYAERGGDGEDTESSDCYYTEWY